MVRKKHLYFAQSPKQYFLAVRHRQRQLAHVFSVSSVLKFIMPRRTQRRTIYPKWLIDLVILWRQNGLTIRQIKTNLADLGYHGVHSATIAAWFSHAHRFQQQLDAFHMLKYFVLLLRCHWKFILEVDGFTHFWILEVDVRQLSCGQLTLVASVSEARAWKQVDNMKTTATHKKMTRSQSKLLKKLKIRVIKSERIQIMKDLNYSATTHANKEFQEDNLEMKDPNLQQMSKGNHTPPHLVYNILSETPESVISYRELSQSPYWKLTLTNQWLLWKFTMAPCIHRIYVLELLQK